MVHLRIERLDGGIVVIGSLAGRRELAVGVRHGEKGLLHRRIEQAALAQCQPGHQRALEFAHAGVSPADAEQRFARVRALQAHPLKNGFCFGGALRLQQCKTQRQVRLVLERQQLLAAGLDAPHPIKVRNGFGKAVLAYQRDTQVELRISGPIRRSMPVAQCRNGIVIAFLPHHQLREQHVAFGADPRVDLVRDLPQGTLGLLKIAALIPDLAQIEPGLVAHRFGRVLVEQRLEYPAGLDMLAQRQVQAAQAAVPLRPEYAECDPAAGPRAGV